jgi:hypothetical protein
MLETRPYAKKTFAVEHGKDVPRILRVGNAFKSKGGHGRANEGGSTHLLRCADSNTIEALLCTATCTRKAYTYDCPEVNSTPLYVTTALDGAGAEYNT